MNWLIIPEKIKIDSLKKKAIYFLTYKNILINKMVNEFKEWRLV